MIETDVGTHGVGDILLGFEPKDAGSTPAGSAVFQGAGFAHPEIRAPGDIRSPMRD